MDKHSVTPNRSNMKRTNFYFPEQMLARLKLASAESGVPVSEIIRRAVEKELVRMKF